MVYVVCHCKFIKYPPVGAVAAPNTNAKTGSMRRLEMPTKLLKPVSGDASIPTISLKR